MNNLEPFKEKLDEMINKEPYRPCMFGCECHGLACEKYWNCNLRGTVKRGNKKGGAE